MSDTQLAPIRIAFSDLSTLPPVMTVPEAGKRGWNMSRATAYGLASRGEFPTPIQRIGSRYYVRSADLLRALGLDPELLLSSVPARDAE